MCWRIITLTALMWGPLEEQCINTRVQRTPHAPKYIQWPEIQNREGQQKGSKRKKALKEGPQCDPNGNPKYTKRIFTTTMIKECSLAFEPPKHRFWIIPISCDAIIHNTSRSYSMLGLKLQLHLAGVSVNLSKGPVISGKLLSITQRPDCYTSPEPWELFARPPSQDPLSQNIPPWAGKIWIHNS